VGTSAHLYHPRPAGHSSKPPLLRVSSMKMGGVGPWQGTVIRGGGLNQGEKVKYHKIQTVWLRDPDTNYKTLLEGHWVWRPSGHDPACAVRI